MQALAIPRRVLVLGSGGREHAVVRALALAGCQVWATRPNPGMAQVARAVDVAADDVPAVVAAAQQLAVDLVMVGPEAPLVVGVADTLRSAGLDVLGPGADGARLEGSKAHAKDFLLRHGIPTAAAHVCHDLDDALAFLRSQPVPPVVKADGLAGGKGVVVPTDHAQAEAAIRAFLQDRRLGDAGNTLVLEERLDGPEVSALALCDGQRLLALDPCRDHKRLLDGDRGPNTGGMGAVCPVPSVDQALRARIDREVLQPTLRGLQADGIDFRGVIYAGLMLTPDGPKVLEYNVRFGDPEAQVLLPRLGPSFAGLAWAAARGHLPDRLPDPTVAAAVTVVLAAAGYPDAPRRGDVLAGLEAAEALAGVEVYHAGTALQDGQVVTAGGRVLAVTGLGPDVAQARERAYAGVQRISFAGMQVRHDIAATA